MQICRSSGWLVVMLAGALFGDATAYTFRVGADAACTHGTIQAAIQTAFDNGPGEDNIYVANNQPYQDQRLFVIWQTVNIIGGRDTCDSIGSGARAQIEGDGAHSVLEIVGDDGTLRTVTLTSLDLSGGGPDNDHGGALQVAGLNRVILENVHIHDNASDLGAGIYFDGADGAQVLVTKGSSIGGFNQASVAGGGIYCTNAAYVLSAPLWLDDSSVGFNSAPDGGGIYLDNCWLRMNSRDATHGVLFNQAGSRGGAIHATNGSTVLSDGGYFAAVDARLLISGNLAAVAGGGVHLDGSEGIFKETEISLNAAPGGDGGGISAVNGSTVRLEAEFTARCTETCTRLLDNQAAFGGGIHATDSAVNVEQTRISENQATRASALYVESGNATIEGTIVAGNLGADGVAEFVSANTEILYATFADNLNQIADLVAAGGSLTVRSSIFQEPQGNVISATGGVTTSFGCLLVHETASLPAVGTIHLGDPLFFDRAGGDYHLSGASPAIDFCSDLAGTGWDQQVRGVDCANHVDLYGSYDLGADEFDDEVFVDGFEALP